MALNENTLKRSLSLKRAKLNSHLPIEMKTHPSTSWVFLVVVVVFFFGGGCNFQVCFSSDFIDILL